MYPYCKIRQWKSIYEFSLCYFIQKWVELKLIWRSGYMLKWIDFTNPRMYLFHNPQCSIHNRTVCIYVLNRALWNMEQVHSGICELGLLKPYNVCEIVIRISSSFLCPLYFVFVNIPFFLNLTFTVTICFYGNKMYKSYIQLSWNGLL